MAQEIINNGTFDNDPSAERIRISFDKVNDNFTDLYKFKSKRYTNASVSGSLALDLDTYDTFNLTLTGATTLSISETLQTDEVKPFTIYVTGNFALTLTGFTIWSGAYDGTLENRITAEQDTSSTIVADIQTKA